MTLAIGSTVPEHTFTVITAEAPAQKTTAELFKGRKVVLFGVPGAFTPTCSNNHLPGFVNHLDAFKAKGVDEVMVIAVNDPHVMKAWAKHSGAGDYITFIADGSAAFAKAAGLDLDLTAHGMGPRSKRFAMLVENGTVKHLNVEEVAGKAETSSAETLLGQM